MASYQAQSDAAASDFAEEAPLALETPARSRSVWRRVAAAAAVSGLVVVAGASWSSGGSLKKLGGAVTGLAATETEAVIYGSVPKLGCSNYASIQKARTENVTKIECYTLCTQDPDCTAINYQEEPCEPGWFVKGGCILFKGECAPKGNKCWSLDYKMVSTVPN